MTGPVTSRQYDHRIRALARRAEAVRESLDPDPPDDECAMEILREGFGPTVALYCEGRTGESWVSFSETEFARLEETMNDWLDCYAACYGVALAGTYSVRAAAELLVDTHNVRDVAVLLTGVPEQ
ncbi:hypothetical protein SAMN05443574_10648 [Haloarcula vallismortis]|uniref:DUF8055 domain-containing protein n=2 Tax=Haloarcula vallismortis TaxID=28442 RepID=M0JFI3_HALVA|nr:hypothetical protein [Haloarcula vallismortis]EMA07751.1 hypothetical protein C437_09923 [Haloarcula vallismortis ATCC 29715]SDW72144.1 hypothetical protein SAMN05443574_10648 [Haloarcula vallismortis]